MRARVYLDVYCAGERDGHRCPRSFRISMRPFMRDPGCIEAYAVAVAPSLPEEWILYENDCWCDRHLPSRAGSGDPNNAIGLERKEQ